MRYTCSLCGKEVQKDLLLFIDHTNKHIIDEIKKKHPDWVDDEGVCKPCEEYFERQLKGE